MRSESLTTNEKNIKRSHNEIDNANIDQEMGCKSSYKSIRIF